MSRFLDSKIPVTVKILSFEINATSFEELSAKRFTLLPTYTPKDSARFKPKTILFSPEMSKSPE